MDLIRHENGDIQDANGRFMLRYYSGYSPLPYADSGQYDRDLSLEIVQWTLTAAGSGVIWPRLARAASLSASGDAMTKANGGGPSNLATADPMRRPLRRRSARARWSGRRLRDSNPGGPVRPNRISSAAP